MFVAIAGLFAFRRLMTAVGEAALDTRLLLGGIILCMLMIPTVQGLCYRHDKARLRLKQNEDMTRLQTQVQTDALTGLMNRETAIAKIMQFLALEGRHDHHTLLIIDLDNFKSINDNFGHLEGDKVIKTISAKIKSVFRSIDIVGRLGGDEFIVFIKHTTAESFVTRKTNALLSAIEYVASGDTVTVTVTGSIGISLYEGDDTPFETLFKEADEAMYRAKQSGKSMFCCYRDHDDATNKGDINGSALKEQNTFVQLQALIDNIDGGIALLEVGAEISSLYMSRSYVRLMGLYSIGADYKTNQIFMFIHEDDVAQVQERLRQGAQSTSPVDAVFRRLTRGGETKWYHLRAVRIPYESSDKPVLLAIVTDVTNLKTAELNYQTQKKQLETVLKISRVVTFEVDIAKRTLYINDPTVIKYGIDVHAIENMPESVIKIGAIHPDSIAECRRMYEEIYAGIPEGSAVIQTVKRDGQYTIERFSYFTVYDDTGRAIKAVGVDEGLDARTQSALRVDLIERQFREYNDNMLSVVKVNVDEDAYVLLKPEGFFGTDENAFKTYTDLLEYRTLQIITPQDRQLVLQKFSAAAMKNDIVNNRFITHEYKVRDRHGTETWQCMISGIYRNQFDGKIYAFIRTRDISFRKNLELMLSEPIAYEIGTPAYTYDTFGRLVNTFLSRHGSSKRSAFMLFSIRNYNEMLRLYGQLMMDDMRIGFAGKILMIVGPEQIPGIVDKNTFVVFIPDMQSETWLISLAEKIIKMLKNPAYFQFHEEMLLNYGCGISVSEKPVEGVDSHFANASRAFESLGEKSDGQIALSVLKD